MYAQMTRETWTLKPGRKTVFELTRVDVEEVDQTFYNNFIDAAPSFRRAGGSEYLERSYTAAGYLVTRVISRPPDRSYKKITTFKFWDHRKQRYA